MAELSKEQLAVSMGFLQKLIGLGIKASLTRVEPGPIVTGYYFKPDHSVPLSKIMNRAEDFALSASVEKVTIQRIGGEVVIFAANQERNIINYKDYLYWFASSVEVAKMRLPIALGVNTLGKKAALDLSTMPHILLAGETGSGKSVFESAILCSLAIVKEPSELQIYLVDTKQVDLPLFSSLPHVKETVTDLKGFHTLMDYTLDTIYRRMETLKGASCRNINEYNVMTGGALPHILVMIDEFGDLLEQDKAAKKSKEGDVATKPKVDVWLQRIVQISRAAGIHVIAGTQRTSVKIISGDIKANFPCRISLRLTTEADSRTILGEGGAENLLGKGDMWVKKPESDSITRYHGPYVDLVDIANILDNQQYLRDQFKVQREVKCG